MAYPGEFFWKINEPLAAATQEDRAQPGRHVERLGDGAIDGVLNISGLIPRRKILALEAERFPLQSIGRFSEDPGFCVVT